MLSFIALTGAVWLVGVSTALPSPSNLRQRADYIVEVSATPSHSIPSSMVGIMFEDINHSGDGGIYAELLQNRAFQQVDPSDQTSALYAWQAVGGADIEVVNDTSPISTALPNSLHVAVPSNSTGAVGVANSGYWGINVDTSWSYAASLYIKAGSTSPNSTAPLSLNVSLVSSTNGDVLGSSTIALTSPLSTDWTQVAANFTPTTAAPDTYNNFTVTFDGAEWSGADVYLGLFSLFPPTFNDRPNGLRIDLAVALQSFSPSFFRFPGGNNLEGTSVATRWIWNNTIGPLTDRPGRLGDWGYINTDGLGLCEMLLLCEDLNLLPIMAVWDGMWLGPGNTGNPLPEDELAPYIQDAINQINYAQGDAATNEYAAQRAQYCREEPFTLFRVELGNEDWFGGDSIIYRWHDFVTNLTAAFPGQEDIFFATSFEFNPPLSPEAASFDEHVYQTPEWFTENTFYWDAFQRNGTQYLQLEYAVTATNESCLFLTTSCGRLAYPTAQGASAEAAYTTGFERNSDILYATSYAPVLQNIQGGDASFQWYPDLISFDASEVYLSASYYVQQLFSLYRGTQYIPSTLPDSSGTTFWSVVQDNSTSDIYVKVANPANTTADLVFNFPATYGVGINPNGTLIVLSSSDPNTANTPADPGAITPQTSAFLVTSTAVSYTAPTWSYSVLKLPALLVL